MSGEIDGLISEEMVEEYAVDVEQKHYEPRMSDIPALTVEDVRRLAHTNRITSIKQISLTRTDVISETLGVTRDEAVNIRSQAYELVCLRETLSLD